MTRIRTGQRALSDLPGADPASVDQALDTLPVEDSNMVSIGATKVIDGKTKAQVEVVRATTELASWLAAQEPGWVYLDPFIRDADTPSVWVAADLIGRRPEVMRTPYRHRMEISRSLPVSAGAAMLAGAT
ncbi:MAG: hypothetical protein QOF53_2930 [Nocardioidaceae bacterium]|nr:hypothetical protein [Nocardioidaceae bacterium]